MARRILRWLGIATLVIGYPLLAHYTNESRTARQPGRAGGHCPRGIACTGAGLAFLSTYRHARRTGTGVWGIVGRMAGAHASFRDGLLAAICGHAVGTVHYFCTHLDRRAPTAVYAIRRGCACTIDATAGNLFTPVTIAWSLFFAAMALASTLLFFLAPLTTWSVFDNFLTLPLVALMFIAEYWVRRRALPDMQHAHILDAVRAFRNTSARPR